MAKITIALSNVTVHVHDPDASIPFEYGVDGKILQGRVAGKAVPPWTPFEIEGEEGLGLLARHNGVRIPDGVIDPREWLSRHADEIGIPVYQRGALADG